MHCTDCGTALKEGTRFCSSCGAAVSGSQEGAPAPDSKIISLERALGNKYKILRKLGSGGFADVYLAEHAGLDRNVAIKILRFSEEADMVERFRRESKAAAKLSHPNIIDIYDVGDSGSTYYFVMKYIPGETLSQRMHKEKRFPPAAAVHIVKQLSDALAYAHDRAIIHRDIKPANVLLDENGKPVLMDFGIARTTMGGQLTRTGTLMGTPHYLPPEQPLGKPVDGRGDIYSLGIMFYEMLAGSVPFHDESAIALIYKHINSIPTPLIELVPGLAPELSAIVHRMIEKLPESRFQTAFDLYEALDSLADIYPVRATPVSARRSTPSATRDTEKLFLLANEHLYQNKLQKAMEIYSTILQRHPEHQQAKEKAEGLLVGIARSASENIASGKFDSARKEIQMLRQLAPADPRLELLVSDLEKQEQSFQKEQEFRSHFEGAEKALKHGNATAAVDLLTKALTIESSNTEANDLLRRARGLYEENRQKAEMADALAEADFHYAKGSYQQALSAVHRALTMERAPRVLELQEKIERAIKEQAYLETERIEISSEVDHLCEALNFSEAQKLLDQMKKAHPDLCRSLGTKVERARFLHEAFLRGEGFAEQGKWDDAKKAFMEFLQVPASYDFKALFGVRKHVEDSLKKAESRIHEQELLSRLKKADVLIRMGQWSEARNECVYVLERKPHFPEAERKLAEIEAKLNPPKPEFPEEIEEPVPPPPPPAIEKTKRSVEMPPIPVPVAPVITPPATVLKSRFVSSPVAMILIAVSVLALVSVGVVLLWNPGSQDAEKPVDAVPVKQTPPLIVATTPAVPTTVAVSIDVNPWATVEISSPLLPQPLKETTPAVVFLPPGEYSVRFSNPEFPGFAAAIQVTQQNRKFQFQFQQLDPGKLANTLVP